MTAEELWDQLFEFLLERITALDVATTLAAIERDDDELLRLRGAHTELTAITEWAALIASVSKRKERWWPVA